MILKSHLLLPVNYSNYPNAKNDSEVFSGEVSSNKVSDFIGMYVTYLVMFLAIKSIGVFSLWVVVILGTIFALINGSSKVKNTIINTIHFSMVALVGFYTFFFL